jgi:2-polyprenyl-6-hydroxyphenyl methylase / 3-demethylubiquinone-9 3-methyltransferase
MGLDERSAALRANVAAYDDLDEGGYINGAPHLKHQSIGLIYRSLVDTAVARSGRAPDTLAVLELGAGNGLASTAWFDHGVQLTAVDSSETMLRGLSEKAQAHGLRPVVVVADALDFLQSKGDGFDVVTHVSMLHHVPDYLSLLERSTARVKPGGSLLIFQDPLRYDRLAFPNHLVDRASYFAWRLGQGNVKRGLKTRWRRLRGVYSPTEVVDFEDYHVVRAGVDSEAIVALLEPSFSDVEVVRYWSTYSRALQRLGERLRLVSSFGLLASGRKPT